MRWTAAVLVAAASVGCGFRASTQGVDASSGDGRGIDAPPDAEIIPVIDAQPCSTAGLIDVCLIAPAPVLPLVNETINTDTDPRCIAGETEGCILGARSITVSGTVTAVGSKPLILVAELTISVEGVLEVSSTRGGAAGAGANTAVCPIAGPGINGASGASGGAGGSFGGLGGSGGRGDNNGAQHNGGVAAAIQAATTVRGGCKGAKGGDGNTGTGGAGGDGGGAVYLAAGVSIGITASGAIYASGAGAGGGTALEAAGGGGGSGGFVGLDAPTIKVDGIIAANGAGGGGGAGTTGSANGGPGLDGTRAVFASVATGGAKGRTDSGVGGTGTGGAITTAQTPAAVNGGAGGGGGGAGIVWVRGALVGTMISPALEQH